MSLFLFVWTFRFGWDRERFDWMNEELFCIDSRYGEDEFLVDVIYPCVNSHSWGRQLNESNSGKVLYTVLEPTQMKSSWDSSGDGGGSNNGIHKSTIQLYVIEETASSMYMRFIRYTHTQQCVPWIACNSLCYHWFQQYKCFCGCTVTNVSHLIAYCGWIVAQTIISFVEWNNKKNGIYIVYRFRISLNGLVYAKS